MARPKAKELTQRELQVMQFFWETGEATAAQARDALAEQQVDLAYTTVATLVRILCDKGFLEATNEQRPFRYQPTRSQTEVSRRLLDELVEQVFGGSRESLLLRLFDRRRLTAREREALRKILEEPQR